jgi:hypothetical protein
MNILIKKLQNEVVRDGDNIVIYVRDHNNNNVEAHLCNDASLHSKLDELRSKFNTTNLING